MRELNFRYLEHNVCQITVKHQTSENFNMFEWIQEVKTDFYIKIDADSMERDENIKISVFLQMHYLFWESIVP
jgi:hypothetical protein